MSPTPQAQLPLFQDLKEVPIKILTVSERPPGHRTLGPIIKKTTKAIQVHYYNWILWIPRKAARRIQGTQTHTAPLWAIETAKAHPSAKRLD